MADDTIDPLFYGFSEPDWLGEKERHFRAWRSLVGEMIGAPVDYGYVRRPVAFGDAFAGLSAVKSLPFLETRILDAGFAQPTEAERAGLWDDTPEEPLLILIFMTMPGGIFQARHAGAIAARLDDLDELVHVAGHGAHTHFHEVARHFFHTLSRTTEDVRVIGVYDPVGVVPVDLLALPRDPE